MSTLGFGACGSSAAGVTTGGVLSQLIALGAADTHLTANPEVTFWRARVQKCTNFAYESIMQTYTGAAAWGSEVQVTLNRTGDLIYWMYVLIDVPGIVAVQADSDNNLLYRGKGKGKCGAASQFPWASPCDPCDDPKRVTDCNQVNDPFEDDCAEDFDDFDDDVDGCTGLRKPYANWVNEIGHAALQRVCFSIGGQVIDTIYSHYMHMWEELSGQPGKRLEEMIGKRMTRSQLVHDSSTDRRLYVPLPFYFTQHSGNALPLVSLQFHSVQIHVTFTALDLLIQTSDCDVLVCKCSNGQPITNNDMNSVLDTTYVYLDMEERDRFAVGSFQQLITQLQQFSTSGRTSSISAQLNFNHPCLELIWALQRKCQADANNTFNYSGPWNTDPIIRAGLRINNLPRFDREATFFRLKVPYEVHTNIPKNFIYCYSFALKPEDCQPSGTLNMSRIDNVEFRADINPHISGTDVSIIIFGRNFNILRFKEGLGGLLFSNILIPACRQEEITWV